MQNIDSIANNDNKKILKDKVNNKTYIKGTIINLKQESYLGLEDSPNVIKPSIKVQTDSMPQK